jgi:hypothetical protein
MEYGENDKSRKEEKESIQKSGSIISLTQKRGILQKTNSIYSMGNFPSPFIVLF